MKNEERIFIKTQQSLMFHVYKHHKALLNEFRIWFVARHVVDVLGVGWVNIRTLCKATGLTEKYLRRICYRSEFFLGTASDRIYYQSFKKIMMKHGIGLRIGKVRWEKKTRDCKKQFISNKLFKAFITKCFAENDLDKKTKYKYTKGRIGYETMAKYFEISKKTAITNIKNSNARPYRNDILHRNIKFSNVSEFGPWLLGNIGETVNGVKIDQLNSFFIKRLGYGSYCLRQCLPNRYKFTGASLVRVSPHRGKG